MSLASYILFFVYWEYLIPDICVGNPCRNQNILWSRNCNSTFHSPSCHVSFSHIYEDPFAIVLSWWSGSLSLLSSYLGRQWPCGQDCQNSIFVTVWPGAVGHGQLCLNTQDVGDLGYKNLLEFCSIGHTVNSFLLLLRVKASRVSASK